MLAKLATTTAEEAKAAALAAVPGTVVQVELDSENGSVVYSVEVDTGNGSVLHQEADDDKAGDA